MLEHDWNASTIFMGDVAYDQFGYFEIMCVVCIIEISDDFGTILSSFLQHTLGSLVAGGVTLGGLA